MTDQALAEILGEADSQASLSPEKPILRPRVTRQGPTGKTPRNGDPLSLDGDSSENSQPYRSTSTRGRARTSTTRTQPLTSSATPPDDNEVQGVEGQLAMILLFGGGFVGMALPVTGATLVMRSQTGAHAIVEVAKTNPKMWKRLVGFLNATKYAELAQVASSVVTAVAVDLHVVNPNSTLPQTIIPDVLEKFRKPEDQPTEQPSPNGKGPEYAGSLFTTADSNGGVESGGPV